MMKFCSNCGAPVVLRIPAGDSIPRYMCDSCHTIHYENPRIVVGSLPRWEDRILLCKRAIQPRHGFWTLPSGFMEKGETVEEGAIRETVEEANASVEIVGLHTLFSCAHINEVYLLFLADLKDLSFSPGPESLDVRLFTKEEIPWSEIAFSAVKFSLKHYFEDPEHRLSPHTGTADSDGRDELEMRSEGNCTIY